MTKYVLKTLHSVVYDKPNMTFGKSISPKLPINFAQIANQIRPNC